MVSISTGTDLAAQLLPMNTVKLQPHDIKASDECVTIGRNANCDLVLPDQRCSSNHCRLWVARAGDGFQFQLEDLSTNGTFVNNVAVGKGNKVPVHPGDTLIMLHEKKVGLEAMVGYTLSLPSLSLKRKLDPPSPSEKRVKLTPVAGQPSVPAAALSAKVDSALSADLECGICTEVIYQCVTLIPCLHNVSGT